MLILVQPGRARLLGPDREPVSGWQDSLFYVKDGEVTPLEHLSWSFRGKFRKGPYFTFLHYQSEGWDTSLAIPFPGYSYNGDVNLIPKDWTMKVLEDYVLGYSPAL